MNKVRVAFIGAGGHATSVHYPSLAEMDDVEIAAVCELNEDRLRGVQEKYGIQGAYTDYRKMVEETAPDAIYLITPPQHMIEPAIALLSMKQNLFIEKPPGVYAEQTRNLARLAEKNDCITMVAFNRRFIPVLLKARQLVEKRGEITQCKALFMKNRLGGGPYYGGVVDILTCDAIHAVDTLRWMGGEPLMLASCVDSFFEDYPNAFNALIRFRSGAVGFLVANWSAGTRIHTFELHSRGISAFIDPDTFGAHIYSENNREPLVIPPEEPAGTTARHHTYGFFGENRHFIDCLKERRQPQTNFTDAVKTMELIERIYRHSFPAP